jgi:signal peptidase II
LSSRGSLLRLGLVGAAVLALDQATKLVVESRLDPGQKVGLVGPVDLTLSYNDGIAFGIASGAGPLVIVLGLLALAALGLFIASAPPGWPTAFAGGLILGGALGNLTDRLTRGEVVDFVGIPFWPAFNVADVAITVGVVALAVIVIRSGREEEGRSNS